MSGDAGRHAVPEPSGDDRRRFLRKKSLLPATLITAQGSFDCRVLDFSAGGAKVECAQPLAEDDALTLVVGAVGTFSGTAVWCGEGCFGVQFDADIAKSAALGGAVLPAVIPLCTEPVGSELVAESKLNAPTYESAGTVDAQAARPLSELLSEIKELRSDFERATQFAGELTTELLFRAYLLFQEAVQDRATAVTLRGEVKRLGLKPSSRSRIQHLAVDVAFPRTKVSPSLRTLYAKAIVGGHSREYTAGQFREAVETGSSGKGGINELARPQCSASTAVPKVAVTEMQSASVSAVSEPADAVLRSDEEYERANGGKRDFEMISLSEGLRERLASEDLAEGAEFLVVVRVVGANELRGVEYLGSCHRASNFPPPRTSPSTGFSALTPAK